MYTTTNGLQVAYLSGYFDSTKYSVKGGEEELVSSW